jgi:hypothetical protein
MSQNKLQKSVACLEYERHARTNKEYELPAQVQILFEARLIFHFSLFICSALSLLYVLGSAEFPLLQSDLSGIKHETDCYYLYWTQECETKEF